MIARGRLGTDAAQDLETMTGAVGRASAGHERVGIVDRVDEPRDTSGNDRLAAGRCVAIMAARLERDVKRGILGGGAGLR